MSRPIAVLPPENRLTEGSGFTLATRRGDRAGGRGVVVHLARTDGHDPARAGFVVSRAVGGSVVRNRVKRRLRHLLRKRLHDLPDGSVVAVRALPASAAMTTTDLGRDLDRALDRALVRALSRDDVREGSVSSRVHPTTETDFR